LTTAFPPSQDHQPFSVSFDLLFPTSTLSTFELVSYQPTVEKKSWPWALDTMLTFLFKARGCAILITGTLHACAMFWLVPNLNDGQWLNAQLLPVRRQLQCVKSVVQMAQSCKRLN
jgi:hypothetical protein